jgi:uncharacterized protein
VLKLLKLRIRVSFDDQEHESARPEEVPEGGEKESITRAIIVHGLSGEPQYAWYPWVASQLETKGITVDIPEMPNPDEPLLKDWIAHLQEVIGTPDEHLVLIGHSLGSVAVLRYLESLPKDARVGKVILVAGFTDQIGFREFDNFFKKSLDFEKIKEKSVGGFIAIQSNDDPFVAEQYGTRLKEDLGAELIIKHAAGHMSGPLDEKESCTELPEVVEKVIDAPVEAVTRRASKVLRKVAISSIVLVILFVGAGLGYTYYMDKQNSAALKSSTNAADQQQGQTITPGKPSPNAPEDASLEVLTTPIARSQTNMVSIKTQAYSTCSIVVAYMGGLVAHDPGLTTKTADDFGSVNWNWNISPTAPLGQGQVKITCDFYKKSAMVEGNFQVTR